MLTERGDESLQRTRHLRIAVGTGLGQFLLQHALSCFAGRLLFDSLDWSGGFCELANNQRLECVVSVFDGLRGCGSNGFRCSHNERSNDGGNRIHGNPMSSMQILSSSVEEPTAWSKHWRVRFGSTQLCFASVP